MIKKFKESTNRRINQLPEIHGFIGFYRFLFMFLPKLVTNCDKMGLVFINAENRLEDFFENRELISYPLNFPKKNYTPFFYHFLFHTPLCFSIFISYPISFDIYSLFSFAALFCIPPVVSANLSVERRRVGRGICLKKRYVERNNGTSKQRCVDTTVRTPYC